MQKLQFIINLMYAIQKKKSIKLNPIKSFIIKLAEFLFFSQGLNIISL